MSEHFTFHTTDLPGVQWIEPVVHGDERGFFMETYRAPDFAAAGIWDVFVQDNHSRSMKGILRGLHLQKTHPQAKLVRCTSGAVWDVAVDVDPASPTFGRWFGIELSAANKHQLYIPAGMAHGFLALEDDTEFVYKCSAEYDPEDETGIVWSDRQLHVGWPLQGIGTPVVSLKDAGLPTLMQYLKECG
ncbi:dTDP-4-dehydrorhamnose 3,5-epimerase [Candidatus Cryosericum hinesii]|jgi:dTDP-4-dehydrorhamnose 3,5-epimerase|uniref:dTDP-4-dehydrorhamnose 3,5-epimerase n=1 Tax=Candidatus Cryosericum hinesii TaxID=2290915 RepID=A0A398DI88_9BACT|nr:dTDP-4-dehydrorhamnose 3,5-epimerase [Candidatus Cryosericum hinesii]RIE07950.1 dTDP-4-dehydrorhamnose 3,5-epimerase [Candidatus Cryosericum hinesii]RIE14143.1 dTDP-4-dehydrorhamnose 3,5-epimerase [Candidatus Cryosericum hinesii]RIE14409.1 dTDP-4-dehydrorhamnose 3,5-epimerase [Candidatus Cryosericum hinesii]